MSRFIVLSFVLLGLLVGFIYGGTLNHSFHFDDIIYITDNLALRDIHDLKRLWYDI